MAYGPDLSRSDIEALKPGDKGRHVRMGGLPNFTVYVSPSGSKSYHVGYRVRGTAQSRRMFLGRHPIISPQQAYEAARQILARRDAGFDPQAELQQRLAEARRDQSETLSVLVPLFLEKHCAKLRSRDAIERVFEVYVLPNLSDRPVKQVSKRDIVAMIDKVEARHGMSVARQAFGWTRTFLGWCLQREIVDVNACTGITLPPPVARERTFGDAEIVLYWRAASRLPLMYAVFLRALLLLGQRLNETATMRWADVDLGAKLWTIPGEVMKGGKVHLVPLPTYVAGMIDKLPRINPWVFTTGTPNNAGELGPIAGFSALKRMLLREMQAVDPVLAKAMPQFGFHDARRTMRTRLSSIGVEASVAERCIAHLVGGGIVRVYDRWAYADEKRAAMEKWCDELLRIVEPPLQLVDAAAS